MATKIIVNNAATANILAEEGITSSLQEIMQPIEAAARLNEVSASLREGLKVGFSSWWDEYALEDEGHILVHLIGHDSTYVCQEAVSAFKEVMWDIDDRYNSRDW